MANPIVFDPKAATQILAEELEHARQLIIAHIRANDQNASGRTIASLHVEVNQNGGILWGHKPFGVLETGRRAGKVPYGFRGIIHQWMRDKGIHGAPIPYKHDGAHMYTPQERGDLSLAGAIAHKIATKGSKLHRDGGRSDVYSNVIPDTLQRINDRLIFLVSQSVDHTKLNNAKIE